MNSEETERTGSHDIAREREQWGNNGQESDLGHFELDSSYSVGLLWRRLTRAWKSLQRSVVRVRWSQSQSWRVIDSWSLLILRSLKVWRKKNDLPFSKWTKSERKKKKKKKGKKWTRAFSNNTQIYKGLKKKKKKKKKRFTKIVRLFGISPIFKDTKKKKKKNTVKWW